MSITAAQLIARVSVEGVDSSSAKLATMGGIISATEGIFARLAHGVGNMAFGLRNLGTAGTIGMDALKQGAMQAGTALVAIGVAAAAAAAIAAVAIGVVSVRAAANFQQGLNRLVTGAGDVTDNMAKMGQSILATSVDSGILTDQLLPAMYQIISAGQRGAMAQNTLAVAARGSVVEQAKIVDVAKALTTAMTDYGTRQFNATQFMNGYTRATQLGKITLEELATSMGPILPLAQNIGLKFADVAAAMSTMTNAGIPAARAATSLRFLFQSLENPTKKAQTAMTEFGLSSIKLGNELKVSLPGALQMVYDAAKKAGPEGSVPFNRAVSDMIGGQRSLQAYLALTGTHLSTFKSNALAIINAMNGSKTAVLGWTVAQGNFNVQMDRAKAALQAVFITIGTALLPVLTRIASAVVPIITAFGQWVMQSHLVEHVMAALGIVFGTIGMIMSHIVPLFLDFMGVLGRLISWVKNNETAMTAFKYVLIAIGALMAASLTLILLSVIIILGALAIAIAAIIAPIMLVITIVRNWGAIMAWAGGVFSGFGTLVHTVFTTIVTTIVGALTRAVAFVVQQVTTIENFFKAMPGRIGAAIANLGAILVAPLLWFYNHNYYVKAAVDAVIKDLTALRNFVGSVFSAIGTFIHDRLVWIQNTVGSAFQAIGTLIHSHLNAAKNDAGNIFSSMGSLVRDKVTLLKNDVGNIFAALGSLMHQKLVGAWNGLVSFASGWPSQAFQWGANVVQGIVNGLLSGLANIRNAVGQIAGAIGNFLGFHSPAKEGPGHDADKWMPNLVTMLAGGLSGGQSKMKAALNSLISPLSTQLSVSANASLGGLSSLGSPGLSAAYARVAVTGSGQTVVINNQPPDIYLDGWKVADRLMPRIAHKLQYGAGINI